MMVQIVISPFSKKKMQETFKEIQKCFSDENHEHALNLVNKSIHSAVLL